MVDTSSMGENFSRRMAAADLVEERGSMAVRWLWKPDAARTFERVFHRWTHFAKQKPLTDTSTKITMRKRSLTLILTEREMGMAAFRRTVSCLLLLIVPASLLAADSGAAMLYANGAAWVNGSHVPNSSAIFAGDLVQTRTGGAANIHASGSSITVLGDSLVKFEGVSLEVEHGGVAVSTSKGVTTTAGDVRVAPASSAWTEFNVTDVDGTVRIAARKGDLTITDDSGTATLAQGQETTRDEQSPESKKKKKRGTGTGAVPAAGGGLLNSPVAIGVGAGVVAGVTIWV